MQSVLPHQNSLKNNSIFLIDRVISENAHPLYITLTYNARWPALLQIFCRNKLWLYTIQVFRRKLTVRRILSEFKMGHLCGLQM